MTDTLRIAELNPKRPYKFEVVPDAAQLKQIAADLDLIDLRKMRLTGVLRAQGKQDWTLEASLGATVVQPCSVTLEPVTTRIDEEIERRYLADFDEPSENSDETVLDDTVEALPATLKLQDIAIEALAIALPLFPRADGAELPETIVTEPGADPMTDDAAKPFAGLADLKKKLEG